MTKVIWLRLVAVCAVLAGLFSCTALPAQERRRPRESAPSMVHPATVATSAVRPTWRPVPWPRRCVARCRTPRLRWGVCR
ncbi:MAG: hypothetical protein ACJ72I_03595 [Pseudonocardiaceae bacterium]